MRGWSASAIAGAAGAELLREPPTHTGPGRAIVDSRQAGSGAMFVGLIGRAVDGGSFAAQALSAGAWGALVTPDHARRALAAPAGAVLTAEDPLGALQRLATAWRRELGARVIGVTGSTGKTSTKELLAALLAPHRLTVASRANHNNQLGVPLETVNAPAGTEVLVLEMAMRGVGEIAELAAIAQPEVGVIVSIGPVHLERLGTIEAIAAAKAELLHALPRGGTAVVPAGEALLAPHLRRSDLNQVTFGPGGDVQLRSAIGDAIQIDAGGQLIELEVSFTQAHMRSNLLAAVAAALAVGVKPHGRLEVALPGRGQRISLPDAITLIDDCYNANPVSMRAALDDLAACAPGSGGRRVAVLGDMLELGPEEREFHREIGRYARQVGVEVLVTVGPLASAMAGEFAGEIHQAGDASQAASIVTDLLGPGDAVLVKGSRGVGLELVCRALSAEAVG